MKLSRPRSLAVLAWFAATPLLVGAAPGRAAGPAAVRVIAEHSPGRFGGVTYRYVVISNASAPITALLIGFDEAGDRLELTVPPYGSDLVETPATSVTSPEGWKFLVTRAEADTVFNLRWEIADERAALWPGSRLSDLSVTIPREDPLYETGHWHVIFGRTLLPLSGRLERGRRRLVSDFTNDPDIWVRPDSQWSSAVVEFRLDAAEDAEVAILGEGGRMVRALFHDIGKQGHNKATWNARDDQRAVVAPGTYYARVRTAGGERFARFEWRR